MNKKLQNFLLAYLRYFPIDYGKARLAQYISFEELPKMHHHSNRAGVIMNLNLHEHSHKNIFLYDYYERNTFLNLKKLIAPHFICVDVGANVGFYTLNLANLLTNGTVHAFEPNPIIFNTLLPDVFDGNRTEIFIGIGSILGLKKGYPETRKKYVFSSGFAANKPDTYGTLPQIDQSCEILCVRGPLTAKALNIPETKAVTDGGEKYYNNLFFTQFFY